MASINVLADLVAALREDAKARGLPDHPDEIVGSLITAHLHSRAVGDFGVDRLTGCPTRHRLISDLNKVTWGQSWTDHSLYQQRFLCVDIDNFKAYLDVHGLTVGDEVLRMISHRLRDHFGVSDVYRFGGDEFVVILGERDVWIPSVPAEVTLKHAVVDVEVQRNQRRNHHINRLIEHHLDAGVLAAKPAGIRIACTTPDWLGSSV